MTEDDARAWIEERYEPARVALLDDFAALLTVESDQQNLVAPSTLPTLWSRHLLDSAQLLNLVPSDWTRWVDIGAGAGLPGIVIAILSDRPVTLIEPRRLRVEFMLQCINSLGLDKVEVFQAKAQSANPTSAAHIVSARAVAKLGALFEMSRGFTSRNTVFVLPKGESAQSEVADARRSWQGTFHVKQSIVDPKSGIVIASGVAPR